MGIFSEADRHPFIDSEAEIAEDARGGAGGDSWLEQGWTLEYVRSAQQPRHLFIHDDQRAN